MIGRDQSAAADGSAVTPVGPRLNAPMVSAYHFALEPLPSRVGAGKIG